ncbi:hypothetical protein GLS40_11475, partial [Pseudooceanicola sp. 216_PA32_1]
MARRGRQEGGPVDRAAFRLWVMLWPLMRPVALMRHRAVALAALRGARRGEAGRMARAVTARGQGDPWRVVTRAVAMTHGWLVADRDPARRRATFELAGLALAQHPRGVRMVQAIGAVGDDPALMAAFDRLGIPLTPLPDDLPPDARQALAGRRAVLGSFRGACRDTLRDRVVLGEAASGLRLAT